MIKAPVFEGFDWLVHGFGLRDSVLPVGIRTVRQIHSSIVLEAPFEAETFAEGDALISAKDGVFVGVKTADCVPILLMDPATRAIAAVHAGWRGTVENIAAATVQALHEKFGVRASDLIAAIGPSIGQCCYEVGPEVARRFGIQAAEKTHVDLPAENEARLRDAGVGKIWKSGECTRCEADRFFSFRREREQAGRMVSFIGRQ